MSARVVFLCTGNICRSPLAEALARRMYRELPLRFASAGLAAPWDHPASSGSAAYAAGRGISLQDHRSRPVTADLLADAAWVVGMTRSHAAEFKSRWGEGFGGKIGVLGAAGLDLGPLRHSPPSEEVADPFGESAEVYGRMGRQVERLLEGWAGEFARLAGNEGGAG